MSSLDSGANNTVCAFYKVNGTSFGTVLPAAGNGHSDRAKRATELVAGVMACGFPWYVTAKQFEMINAPGDCLYVPPAVLLDIDESYRTAAGPWSLQVATLEHPDTGIPFVHAWLKFKDLAVSVSGLQKGRPIIALPEVQYLTANRCLAGPFRITRRRLRAKARLMGLGPPLARWIITQVS